MRYLFSLPILLLVFAEGLEPIPEGITASRQDGTLEAVVDSAGRVPMIRRGNALDPSRASSSSTPYVSLLDESTESEESLEALPSYFVQQREQCEFPFKSLRACSEAAQTLQVALTFARDDEQSDGEWYDPPWCYLEEGVLKFNYGFNVGGCNSVDQCICGNAASAAEKGAGHQFGAAGDAAEGHGVPGFAKPRMAGEPPSFKQILDHAEELRHEFFLQKNANCANPIKSREDCGLAAWILGLSSAGAVDDVPVAGLNNRSSWATPPHCYVSEGLPWFNAQADVAGTCSGQDVCICGWKSGSLSGQVAAMVAMEAAGH